MNMHQTVAATAPRKRYSETPNWWRKAVGYQIYPRSFCDSNGDGIGDIPGIISRLEHLQDLGVGFIWLSPIYASPMHDNGYDISDYQAIAPEFGTMEDFERLLLASRECGIGIVMDLVVNHCSSEHSWFKAALQDANAPEHDFFVWRKPAADGGPPSDRQSDFGGSAWEYVPAFDKYYLHQFAKEQPDLNWDNPTLRAKIYEMINWWLEKGVAGFRLDVIDRIGKNVDANIYADGPFLHERLQEMYREAFAGRNVLSVGETWSVTPETALLYAGKDRHELEMVFAFDHVVAGWDPDHGKWRPRPFSLMPLKSAINTWQVALQHNAWAATFLSNHDLPRQVSTYGDDGQHRIRSAKMLATVIHLLRGTPFIYQGEEIGMTNASFSKIEQFNDIEIRNHYGLLTQQGMSHDEFVGIANIVGRDNARTPMQWTGEPNAGFTTGTPWLEINHRYREINVASDRANRDGIFDHYKQLADLRRAVPVISEGGFTPHLVDHPTVLAYSRHHAGIDLVVVANFSSATVEIEVTQGLEILGSCISYNIEPRDRLTGRVGLAPFECFAILSDI